MTPIDITRRLAAAQCPINGLGDACAFCDAWLPSPDTGDHRPRAELLQTPDWHADGCAWAEAVLWDAYHPNEHDVLLCDHLVPRPWRRRLSCIGTFDRSGRVGRFDVVHRRSGARLAAVVADDSTFVCADGNMVTRWKTLTAAVFEACRPREGWPLAAQLVRSLFGGTPAFFNTSPVADSYLGAVTPDPRWDDLQRDVVWSPGDRSTNPI